MAFDSTKPVNGAVVISAELRGQFNGLNDKITAQAAIIAGLQAQLTAAVNRIMALENAGYATQSDLNNAIGGTGNNVNGIEPLNYPASDPPTQAEVQGGFEKLAELINGLHR